MIVGAHRLSARGLAKGPHITRHAMYRRLREVGRELAPSEPCSVLSISHSTHLAEVLGLDPAWCEEANYPEQNILDLSFEDDRFDWVVSDQVLEHVGGSPIRALEESRRVLKPGGIAVHTTCFMNPVHGSPDDYWRFTPNALSLLCERYSEVVEAGGWGNPMVFAVGAIGLGWEGVPEASWHPLNRIARYNDPKWPVMTWVVACK